MGSILLSFFTFVAFFFAPVTSLHTTKYEVGPGTKMRLYTLGTGSGMNPVTGGKPSSTNWVGSLPILAYATATGANAGVATELSGGPDGNNGVKYSAVCIANPFRRMGSGTGSTYFNTGSGIVMELVYQNIRNPNAAAGDVGLVHNCEQGSGQTLLNNLCTVSGCTAVFVPTATNGLISGYDFIKLGMSKNPTQSFRAFIYTRILGVGEDMTKP